MNVSEKSFTIVPATWRDLNVLRQVEQVCFPQDAWPLWDLIAVLTLPDIVRLKAMADDKLVGFIAGDIRRREHLGWITTIGVLPQYRQRGIASALMEDCEQAMGMPRVRLCVRKSNVNAIRLYADRGYLQYTVWPSYYHDGEDAYVMEKYVGSAKRPPA